MKKQRTQKEKKIKPIVLGLVILISFGAGFLIAHLSEEHLPGIDTEDILWPSPPKVNAFFLEDIEKKPFTLENLTGRWSILFFGFANCPDICPSTLQSMTKAENVLRSNPAFGESGQLIFVSVDPDRDTPEILKIYTTHFSPQLIAITGPENELDILTRSVGAIYLKTRENSKNYSIDHSAGIFFISPEGLLLSVLTPPIFDQGIIDRFEKIVSFRRKFL